MIFSAFSLSNLHLFIKNTRYGEIVDLNLVRDKVSGKSKGYAFLAYEDQRSTVLAVDNLTGLSVLGRIIRVDHVHKYKIPKDALPNQVMPNHTTVDNTQVTFYIFMFKNTSHQRQSSSEDTNQHPADLQDPMRDYLSKKEDRKKHKKSKKSKKSKVKENDG